MSNITDDAMVVEQETGVKVALGRRDLIRILRLRHRRIFGLAEAFLQCRKNVRIKKLKKMKNSC